MVSYVYRRPPTIRLPDVYLFPSGVVSWEQEGFRWRDDDANEVSATWLQDQGVQITRATATTTRLRILSVATGDPDTSGATLEYKRTQEPASEWRAVA